MEKSTQETVKSEKVKPEKELCDGEDDRLSQLGTERDEELLGTIGDDMEDVDDVAVREILAKDQGEEEDVLENSPVEPNDQDVREVKGEDKGKEDVVSVVVPVDEVSVENTSMVEPSLSSDASAAQGRNSDPGVVNNLSVSPVLKIDSSKEEDVVREVVVPGDEGAVENREVETSLPLTPSSDASMVKPSLKGQGQSLLEQNSDSPVINNVSVPPVHNGKDDVASAVMPVDEVTEPLRVEPSLPSVPSAAKGQGLSLLQKSYDSRVVKNLAVSPLLRTPPRDGYNWRKYGQKQVKSPKGSRSYYRCTYSECCAKKIECSNASGNMVEIVNKGLHSHEPPQKIGLSPRGIRAAASDVTEEDKVVAAVPSDSAPPPSTKDNICQSPTIVERKRNCESKGVEEPEPKRRLNKENTQSSVPVSKPGKKPRLVVHAAGDVGISGDGYRWRKYGQKMVKGNPNPRNYYRCTSAGCPVRKHIETSVENTRDVIITYKGEHNHDTPVPPKKRHDTPSSVLSSPGPVRTRLDDQVNISSSSSQCSVGRESEKQSSEALDVVGG